MPQRIFLGLFLTALGPSFQLPMVSGLCLPPSLLKLHLSLPNARALALHLPPRGGGCNCLSLLILTCNGLSLCLTPRLPLGRIFVAWGSRGARAFRRREVDSPNLVSQQGVGSFGGQDCYFHHDSGPGSSVPQASASVISPSSMCFAQRGSGPGSQDFHPTVALPKHCA